MRGMRGIGLSLCVVLLAACQTGFRLAPSSSETSRADSRVVLMPVDVELYRLTLAGLPEPKADWTEQAKGHLTSALDDYLGRKRAKLVPFADAKGDPERQTLHDQLIKLHEVVAGAIALHAYTPRQGLPAKRSFDWSLGDSTQRLAEEQGADYAVFVYLRDTYAGGGRMAFMVLAGLLTQGGYVPPGGVQQGYASLVELKTGRVLWFNRLARQVGDVRELEPARSTVAALFEGFPG